mmetsp:Transcript_70260/g.124099  ORF Transcript_70260/g.124099 Transcript_70260/m.124099 type:complete len:118 (+) Transcript_70260:82-435(+)
MAPIEEISGKLKRKAPPELPMVPPRRPAETSLEVPTLQLDASADHLFDSTHVDDFLSSQPAAKLLAPFGYWSGSGNCNFIEESREDRERKNSEGELLKIGVSPVLLAAIDQACTGCA